ncbi:hypothetical protein [Caldimonas thermodepolymerans]|jgi:hypothetical protein|uniref:Uncharacterized protein n=1 Tax=Caldimonas thermodepolymerans TaxID=215580 RepID=A0AA46DBZ7_9BURK|nr:hypothetical protein [Caldimonas thermodepolymerans]TCP06135.1 hypothetical protein EV676_1075 [Caldimonas thermodepolymerans]UZG48903.1 hypothetical protein ONS87_04585 [Caldimonas thermodepolymerans]
MIGALIGAIAAAAQIGPGGGEGPTPTAPAILGYNHGEVADASQVTTTINGVNAGDLLLVFGAVYHYEGSPPGAVVVDTILGDYSDSNTYTSRAGPVDATPPSTAGYLHLEAWTAVAQASGNVTFKLTGGRWMSIVALRISPFHAAILDVSPATLDVYQGSGAELLIDLGTTTYSHCLVVGCYTWWDSSRMPTYSAEWPLITGRNDGNNDYVQMVAVGKQVTAVGNWDPVIIADSVGSEYVGIGLVIRGKDV